ncbi:ADP-ribosyl cyclase/cyclic ADP-ribose hydrolase-like [Ptychodera flava]|uniref:ADP-ribosyl cyclase/cyclic ADP-ribose hydrolase-like n=1 Tax=Ptychodera flava TaxID=63121 RepID=UPI003969C1D6
MMTGPPLVYVLLVLTLILNEQVQNSKANRLSCEGLSSADSEAPELMIRVSSRPNCYYKPKIKKTPKNLTDIFIAKCKNHTASCPLSKGENCRKLWHKFKYAFAYEEACINRSRYEPYCKEARHYVPKNKALFYSGEGPYKATHDDAIPYVTLEHTMTGNVMDGLDYEWCGQLEGDGINYEKCPDRKDCVDPFTTSHCAFWQQASIEFAKQARGEVRVLLDGANKNGAAFYNSSYFAEYELKNLNKNFVRRVHILVMNSTENINETCGTGSILELEKEIKRLFKDRSVVTCKNFTGFTDEDWQNAINGTQRCHFRSGGQGSGSPVEFDFLLLLICTLYAFVTHQLRVELPI